MVHWEFRLAHFDTDTFWAKKDTLGLRMTHKGLRMGYFELKRA